MEDVNAVPCVTWVKRGVSKRQPDRVKLTEEELSQVVQNLQNTTLDESGSESDEDNENEEPEASSRKRKRKREAQTKEEESDDEDGEEDITEKYGLEQYDEDEDLEETEDNPLSVAGLTYYSSSVNDPHLNKKEDEYDSEDEELEIRPDDNLLVIGKVSGSLCNMEVHLYNKKEGISYCHHDNLLPSFPLAIEWLDFDPGEDQPGNFVALSYMTPDIEIWDLDVVNTLEPAFVLKGAEKKKGKKKKLKTSSNGHTDAVLDLSWNHLQRDVLASASADFTVGLWDLKEGKMVSSMRHHQEKVQTLDWHPCEAQTLLSGSFDRTAVVCDCRTPNTSQKSWTLSGEVERVLWNHLDPYYMAASTDSGDIFYLDVRQNEPLFTWSGHSEAVTGLAFSPDIPGCLATASADKTVKLWNIKGTQPRLITKKSAKVGLIHCISACPDSSLLFAIGGEREYVMLNLERDKDVSAYLSSSKIGSDDCAVDEAAAAESERSVKTMSAEPSSSGLEAAAKATSLKKKKKKKKKQNKGGNTDK